MSLTQCGIDPANSRYALVDGTLLNHDAQSDDYSISVTVLEGSTQAGSAFELDTEVPAGQSTP